MCDRCVWQRAIPCMQRLLEQGNIGSYRNFVFETLRWVESNKHITPKQLSVVAKIEARAGLKKKGGSDVQQDRSVDGRTGSGLFR
jgi:hypothetical protein